MKNGNLLLVDDEPLILELMTNSLEDYPHKIFTAGDGDDALKILESEIIHCIVCDVNMPRMNGVEVIKKAREMGITAPFIFYTAHGNRKLMQEVAKYGVFDFLNKPNLEGLEEVVANGLRLGTSPKAESAQDNTREIKDLLAKLKE